MNFVSLILTLAIVCGQLIKFPRFNGGGVTILDTAVLIITLIGLIRLKLRLKKPPLFIIGALIFILVAIISLILTPLKLQLGEYLISFFYILRFAAYIFLGWVIFSGAFPKLRDEVAKILIYSGLGLTFLGLLQFTFLPNLEFLKNNGWDPHYFRTVSTFLDPNFLGGFLVLTLLVLSPQFCLKRRNILTPRVFYLLFGLVYLALLATFSRGSYLAFLASFITLAYLYRSFKLGVICIVLFLGLLLGFNAYQINIAAPRGIDRIRYAEFRLNTWQQGAILFQQHLVLGVGFNAYRYALEQYHLTGQDFLLTRGSSTNDSSLLFVAASTGIVGLFSFLFFLSSLIKNYKQNPLLIAGILGLVIQSFFANTLFYPFNLIWVILMSSKLSKNE